MEGLLVLAFARFRIWPDSFNVVNVWPVQSLVSAGWIDEDHLPSPGDVMQWKILKKSNSWKE